MNARVGPYPVVEWPLVNPHHERHRSGEESVESRHDVDEEFTERIPRRVVEGRKIWNGSARSEENFVWPTGSSRNPCVPVADTGDQAIADRNGIEAAVHPIGREFGERGRGHVGERIDLSMRMGDCRSDFGAAVLEHENVRNIVACSQCRTSFGPEIDDLSCLQCRKVGKGCIMIGRVEHDLGPSIRKRGPPVGEGAHLV